jgi:hypothetical protein
LNIFLKGTYQIKCSGTYGYFRLMLTTSSGDDKNKIYSNYIHTNFTVKDLRESIETMNAVSVSFYCVFFIFPTFLLL